MATSAAVMAALAVTKLAPGAGLRVVAWASNVRTAATQAATAATRGADALAVAAAVAV